MLINQALYQQLFQLFAQVQILLMLKLLLLQIALILYNFGIIYLAEYLSQGGVWEHLLKHTII